MDLKKLFEPKSIAIVGASRNPESVGQGIIHNLLKGGAFQSEYCRRYQGHIYPINPHAETILGLECFPSIKAIPGEVDLAIICVPAKIVPSVVKESIAKKVKAIIIISAGFSETGNQGKKLEEDIRRMAQRAKIPILGPNCLGLIRPSNSMNASFAPSMPPEGSIAFISQSGAIADSVIDWAIEKRYGFSTIVSYGNQAFLTSSDLLEYLENDPHTKSIAIYAEGIPDGKRFMEVAKKVATTKPIVIIKAGRTNEGSKAAMSHTGTLASPYNIYKAAFKQSGLFVANTVEELFDMTKALANQPRCKENNIGIITNGGGLGVLSADYCSLHGINIAELKKSVIKKLDKHMPASYSKRNPLDILGDATPERYSVAIKTLLQEKDIHGLIVMQTLQTMTKPEENARIIVEAKKEFPDKPIITVFMGGRFISRGVYILEKNKVPNYNDVSRAVNAMKTLIERK